MSFIVRGFYKPQSCETWKNGRFRRCWFLSEYDNCRLQEDTRKLDLHEQYMQCPIIRVKRHHGALMDVKSQEIYLEAEENVQMRWGL